MLLIMCLYCQYMSVWVFLAMFVRAQLPIPRINRFYERVHLAIKFPRRQLHNCAWLKTAYDFVILKKNISQSMILLSQIFIKCYHGWSFFSLLTTNAHINLTWFCFAAPAVSVQLPIDFFESCTQTNDIEYGGNDILEIYNKNLVKQRLATTNQYIASTKVSHSQLDWHWYKCAR